MSNPEMKQDRSREARLQAVMKAWDDLCVRADKNSVSPLAEALTCPDCREPAKHEQIEELLNAAHNVFADKDGAACPMMAALALVTAGLVLLFEPGAHVVEDVLRHVDELIAAEAHGRLFREDPQVVLLAECSALGEGGVTCSV